LHLLNLARDEDMGADGLGLLVAVARRGPGTVVEPRLEEPLGLLQQRLDLAAGRHLDLAGEAGEEHYEVVDLVVQRSGLLQLLLCGLELGVGHLHLEG